MFTTNVHFTAKKTKTLFKISNNTNQLVKEPFVLNINNLRVYSTAKIYKVFNKLKWYLRGYDSFHLLSFYKIFLDNNKKFYKNDKDFIDEAFVVSNRFFYYKHLSKLFEFNLLFIYKIIMQFIISIYKINILSIFKNIILYVNKRNKKN
jgi:hypothetical protein